MYNTIIKLLVLLAAEKVANLATEHFCRLTAEEYISPSERLVHLDPQYDNMINIFLFKNKLCM